ncbi:hypothetical protein J6590_046960 [Homalodisca vitripennis]|nr:hypothetical protein J6590_046960 [Homalodisca vitripennis]
MSFLVVATFIAVACFHIVHTRPGEYTKYHPSTVKDEKLSQRKDVKPKPPAGAFIPSPEEYERLIRENGFILAVLMKMFELVCIMLSAPFRSVFRVFQFLFVVLKLAEEALRQMNHRKTKIS